MNEPQDETAAGAIPVPESPRVPSPPTDRPENPPQASPVVGLALAGVVGLLGLAAWYFLAPSPQLDPARFASLVRNKQFDLAESELRAALGRSSRDPQASFLLAQLMLEQQEVPVGTNPTDRAEEALELIKSSEGAPRVELVATPAILAYYRGKALYQLDRLAEAEAAWKEALALDARVPEASWSLLELFYVENRRLEARRLVLDLEKAEPDPHDRAQLLLELVRQDTLRPDSGSLVLRLTPVATAQPNDVSILRALGLWKIKSSDIDGGVETLKALVEANPADARAWDGWLEGLDLAGNLDTFRTEFDRTPQAIREAAEFARHRGLAAQIDQNWKQATTEFEKAVELDPTELGLLVRLAHAVKFSDPSRAEEVEQRVTRFREASTALLDLYTEANAINTLGLAPHEAICERLASSREAMNRPDEAAIWRTLGPGAMPGTRAAAR